jgi:hypothetical protein
MIRLIATTLFMSLIWVVPALAACANYEGREDAPAVLLCEGGTCMEATLSYECGNAFGAQFGYSNGLSIDCVAENGASECAVSLSGRRITDGLSCTNLNGSQGCTSALATVCAPYMPGIRGSFDALPVVERMLAQELLQTYGHYPYDMAIDGVWGAGTQAAMERFCRSDLQYINLEAGNVTVREAASIPQRLADLMRLVHADYEAEAEGDMAEWEAAQAGFLRDFPSQMFDCQPTNDGHFSTMGTLFFSVFDDPYYGAIRYMEFNGLRPVEYQAMLSFYDFTTNQPSWWGQFVATDLEHIEESRSYGTIVGVTDENLLISDVSFVQIAGELTINGSGGPTTFSCVRLDDRETVENNFSYFQSFVSNYQNENL